MICFFELVRAWPTDASGLAVSSATATVQKQTPSIQLEEANE